MNFEIVTMPGLKVIGKEVRTTNKDFKCAHDISHLWNHAREKHIFAPIHHTLGHHTVVGLYTDYTPNISATNGEYTFIAGVPVEEFDVIPEGMVIREIPSTTYAVFTAKGPFEKSIGKVWFEEIWKCTDFKRAFTYDFEWYDAHSTNDEHSVVKIYISIR